MIDLPHPDDIEIGFPHEPVRIHGPMTQQELDGYLPSLSHIDYGLATDVYNRVHYWPQPSTPRRGGRFGTAASPPEPFCVSLFYLVALLLNSRLPPSLRLGNDVIGARMLDYGMMPRRELRAHILGLRASFEGRAKPSLRDEVSRLPRHDLRQELKDLGPKAKRGVSLEALSRMLEACVARVTEG